MSGTSSPEQRAKRQAAIQRLKDSLIVPKRYSINTATISDADKTRLIQRGNVR